MIDPATGAIIGGPPGREGTAACRRDPHLLGIGE